MKIDGKVLFETEEDGRSDISEIEEIGDKNLSMREEIYILDIPKSEQYKLIPVIDAMKIKMGLELRRMKESTQILLGSLRPLNEMSECVPI